jgi:predicted transposase YbfD/YdcC
MATGFAYSRTIVRISSRRLIKKSGHSTEENRYYLASQEMAERTPEGWIELTRQHWAGVENRNHWRRDATLGEDGTRLRNARALINLALVRSVNLRLLAARGAEDWLPAQKEHLAANPNATLALVRAKL